MVEKTYFSITKYDIWKLIGATLLIFCGLVISVGNVGESQTFIQKDFFKEGVEIQEHKSAQKEADSTVLSTLCFKNEVFCKKVVYTWGIAESDKILYTDQYLQIIKFLDENLLKGADIKKQFKKLVLNGEEGKRRGWATWTRITMNLASLWDLATEYWWVLTHEFWHIVDLGLLQGMSKYKDFNFTEFGKVKFSLDDPSLEYYHYARENESIRKPQVKKSDFCSWYGMTNPFEDFAECHNLYLNNKSLFQLMATESSIMKNKYNFLANLFDDKTLTDNKYPLLYEQRRPWDTTLI